MHKLLNEYKRREGDCNVPRGHKENQKNIGAWLRKQRTENKAGTLDSRYAQRLKLASVFLDSVHLNKWNQMYKLLTEYKRREGDCNIPRDHKENQKNLGAWLASQRTQNKAGTLDSRYVQNLTEIGVVWDVGLEL